MYNQLVAAIATSKTCQAALTADTAWEGSKLSSPMRHDTYSAELQPIELSLALPHFTHSKMHVHFANQVNSLRPAQVCYLLTAAHHLYQMTLKVSTKGFEILATCFPTFFTQPPASSSLRSLKLEMCAGRSYMIYQDDSINLSYPQVILHLLHYYPQLTELDLTDLGFTGHREKVTMLTEYCSNHNIQIRWGKQHESSNHPNQDESYSKSTTGAEVMT